MVTREGRVRFEGIWRNEPPHVGHVGEALVVRTGPDTDWWNNTYYGFVHLNGHFLGSEAAGDRTLQLTFSAGYERQYDQAGAMVRVDDENWMKCGIEFTEGVMKFSVVVTRDGRSDWSVRPWRGEPAQPVTLRVTRHAEALRIDCLEDGAWHLVRLCFLSMPESVAWGPMACSPSGEGLEVTFSAIALGPAIARETV